MGAEMFIHSYMPITCKSAWHTVGTLSMWNESARKQISGHGYFCDERKETEDELSFIGDALLKMGHTYVGIGYSLSDWLPKIS